MSIGQGLRTMLCCDFVLCQSVAAKKRGVAVNTTEASEAGQASKRPRLDQQPSGSDDDQLGDEILLM